MDNDYMTSACSSGGCSSCGSSCEPKEFKMKNALEKPLGKITAVLADLGMEVTYAYDDLVFVQHSAFLLQFTEDPGELKLFTNTECYPDEAEPIVKQIIAALKKAGFEVNSSGYYTLTQNEDDTLQLEFCG
jgi:hypothetical protein